MMPQAIFFDLDQTLIFLDHEVGARKQALAWRDVAAEVGLQVEVLIESHRSVTPGLWRTAEARGLELCEPVDGLSLMLETYRQALLACGCDADDLARRAFECFWANRHGVVQAFEDVIATLDKLRDRALLAVITNGPAITQLDKLQVTGLDCYFDLIVASGDIGYAKPDASIFQFALDKLGVAPELTWHVGDNPASDVLGAHNAGLTSVWLNRQGLTRDASHPEPHHEIASLSQLMDLLDGG